jgi:UDP-glucuronate 4-epimerase
VKKKILVTGSAGFIGFHVSQILLEKGYNVYGVDNYSKYYDVNLKKKRTSKLKKYKNFFFNKFDLKDEKKVKNFVKNKNFEVVVHMAAQPGVRLSFINRKTYFDNNIKVFFNMVEICLSSKIKHFIYASSSSVYGETKKFPNKESDNTDNQVSFYAATKKCNEIIASCYSQMTETKFTGLRFFTVYGPLGRPDMALYKFTKNLYSSKKISIYNNGNHSRDFTYIEDVSNLILKIVEKKLTSFNKHNIFNICFGKTVSLAKYINLIEKFTGLIFLKKFVNKQSGDVTKTFGDNKKILNFLKYKIKFKVDDGVKKFIHWFDGY